MAQLPTLKRFLVEDYQSAGPWITKFLYVLNLFTSSVWSALNSNLTFKDNMLSQIATLPISGIVPATSFKWNFPQVSPIGIILLNIVDSSTQPETIVNATTVAWSYSSGSIIISNITGLNASKSYSATFLVVGG